MNTTPSGIHRGPYLIVMADVLIREDLRQAIAEVVSDANITLADNTTMALDIVKAFGAGLVAFVAVEPAHFAGSDLAHALADIGARIVLTAAWDTPANVPDTWAMLPFPFASSDVRDVLVQTAQAA